MLGYLSLDITSIAKSFVRLSQGQISEHIFARNGGYCQLSFIGFLTSLYHERSRCITILYHVIENRVANTAIATRARRMMGRFGYDNVKFSCTLIGYIFHGMIYLSDQYQYLGNCANKLVLLLG